MDILNIYFDKLKKSNVIKKIIHIYIKKLKHVILLILNNQELPIL